MTQSVGGAPQQPQQPPPVQQQPQSLEEWLVFFQTNLQSAATQKAQASTATGEQAKTQGQVNLDAIQNFLSRFSKLSANSPQLPPPPTVVAPPGTGDGVGNQWLKPNRIAEFFSILLDILALQSEIKFAEGQLAADLIIRGYENAEQSAGLQREIGQERAQQTRLRAAAAFTQAAVGGALAANSARAGLGARGRVDSQNQRNATNPHYGSKPNAQVKGVEKHLDHRARAQKLETKLQNTSRLNPNRLRLQQKLDSEQRQAAKYEPGVDDIKAYDAAATGGATVKSRSADEQKHLTTLQDSKQKALDDFPQNRETLIGQEASNRTLINNQLAQNIPVLAQGVTGILEAESQITQADLEALNTQVQQIQTILSNAADTARRSKDEHNDNFGQIINFLREVIQAETRVFGFQGGSITS